MYQPKEGSAQYNIILFANKNNGRFERKEVREYLEKEGYKNTVNKCKQIIYKLQSNGVLGKTKVGYEVLPPYDSIYKKYYKIMWKEEEIYRTDDVMEAFKKGNDLRKQYNDYFKIYECRGKKDVLLMSFEKTRIQ